MANIDIKPTRTMPNAALVFPTYPDQEDKTIVHAIVEITPYTINKYELVNETGHLKLDRVGYSSLAYPLTYGAIPQTLDEDEDFLDIVIANVTEPLIPGSIVEARIIGIIKFNDGGEQDDKVIAVINDDKRQDEIKSFKDLGEHFEKEVTYYFEHYKDLKKPGTCKVEGFLDTEEAIKVVDESIERYDKEFVPTIED
jgi:inorganic pyrophosphatase